MSMSVRVSDADSMLLLINEMVTLVVVNLDVVKACSQQRRH
jgi:hypothetical protein